MDKTNDHVSIDVKEVAKYFEGKIKNLNTLSKDCCIYEVPPKIRMLDESLYTPKMVSIGPLHYGRKELKVMEEHKLRYLQQIRQRTSVSLEKFIKLIMVKEVDLRNCYADTIQYGSESFVKIIFLDAVFLIEIFLRTIPQFGSVDRVFSNPGKIKDIVFDVMILENQLPMFILQELFKLAKLQLPGEFKERPLSWFAREFLTVHICPDILTATTSIESYFSDAEHLVDWLRLCLQPRINDGIKRQDDCETAPNITDLHQSGIMLEQVLTNNLLNIKFEKGTLKIPKLIIGNMTIHLLRNLQMFESLHSDTNFINDYNVLLHRLLSAPQDVELLIKAKVIENRVSDSEGVSTLFRELSRDARVNIEHFSYSGLVKDLQDYSRSKRHKWMAILLQKHFSNPWLCVSVLAASAIVILTLLQTIFSGLALPN